MAMFRHCTTETEKGLSFAVTAGGKHFIADPLRSYSLSSTEKSLCLVLRGHTRCLTPETELPLIDTKRALCNFTNKRQNRVLAGYHVRIICMEKNRAYVHEHVWVMTARKYMYMYVHTYT